MKYKKPILTALVLVSCLVLFCSMPVFAAELTEAQVEEAVAEQGKEAVTGNVFIWFLCAIAFLKVSQKIDSFMASLGINVGNTGGNMMAELLIAGRGLAGAFHGHGGGGGYRRASSPGSAAVGGSFLSGGLAGAVGRQVQREAVNAATHYSEGPSVGNMLYQSSLKKGGDFANNVISNIAQGNYGQVGSIKGEDAAKAYASYMGIDTSAPDAATYSNMEIGGGRMTGVEKTDAGSREFALYSADQYAAPTHGSFETVQSVDGAAWYKQYAQDTVEKTPYDAGNGKVAYNESIVQKLPACPAAKGPDVNGGAKLWSWGSCRCRHQCSLPLTCHEDRRPSVQDRGGCSSRSLYSSHQCCHRKPAYPFESRSRYPGAFTASRPFHPDAAGADLRIADRKHRGFKQQCPDQ